MSFEDDSNRSKMRRFNLEEEYDAIGKLDDPVEQGYRSGPLILQAGTDAHPELDRRFIITVMLHNARFHPVPGDENNQRDVGLIRWCEEQLCANSGSFEA